MKIARDQFNFGLAWVSKTMAKLFALALSINFALTEGIAVTT
jgi:hypothetical protein